MVERTAAEDEALSKSATTNGLSLSIDAQRRDRIDAAGANRGDEASPCSARREYDYCNAEGQRI
jgi:hypothetical protein